MSITLRKPPALSTYSFYWLAMSILGKSKRNPYMECNSQAFPPPKQTCCRTAACFGEGQVFRLELYKSVNKLSRIYPWPHKDLFFLLHASHKLLCTPVLPAAHPSKQTGLSPTFFLWSFGHLGSTQHHCTRAQHLGVRSCPWL